MKAHKLQPAMMILALVTLAVIILASQATRAAGLWYVAPGGNDSNTCASPGAPCATINGAIGKAVSGDTIFVATGMYTSTGTEVVLLDRNATLSGGWNISFTAQDGYSTIDGQGERRGLSVDNGVTVTVEYLTVQNGSNPWGGGIGNWGNLILNNSNLQGNTAYEGGSIRNSGIAILNGCLISGNRSQNRGGGISNLSTGNLTLNNSTISGNQATTGGGGGLFNGGTLTLNSSTVSSNTCGNAGGGIYTEVGTTTLQNTVLAGNSVPLGTDCWGGVSSTGYNLLGNTAGCSFTPGAGDLVNVNPGLFPLMGSPAYHPLARSSPAIDAGNPTGCTDGLGHPLDTDQRGVARVGRCDIGAYEYDPDHDPLKYIFLPMVLRQ